MQSIIYAVAVLGALGIVFGALLGLAAKIFKVDIDERIPEIVEALPGANCGACGFPGCSQLAVIISKGEAPVNACTVGGNKSAEKIAEIMGAEFRGDSVKKAFVKCLGTGEKSKDKFIYDGISDCRAAHNLSNGNKSCQYSCLGLGSCKNACNFDAITIDDDVVKINKAKCTSCGKCAVACPRDVIELLPERMHAKVVCNSKSKGTEVRSICEVGCIACKICQKACPVDAIKIESNLAKIDGDKCTACGLCVSKCPRQIIKIS